MKNRFAVSRACCADATGPIVGSYTHHKSGQLVGDSFYTIATSVGVPIFLRDGASGTIELDSSTAAFEIYLPGIENGVLTSLEFDLDTMTGAALLLDPVPDRTMDFRFYGVLNQPASPPVPPWTADPTDFTTASVLWSQSAVAWSQYPVGTVRTTPNLASVANEVLDSVGHSAGDMILILMTAVNVAPYASNGRELYAAPVNGMRYEL